MKFPFETMRFLLKYITLNQRIVPAETFYTYFTTFQIAAPRRITNKISQIANSQQFGLFLSSKLASFCPPTPKLGSDSNQIETNSKFG